MYFVCVKNNNFLWKTCYDKESSFNGAAYKINYSKSYKTWEYQISLDHYSPYNHAVNYIIILFTAWPQSIIAVWNIYNCAKSVFYDLNTVLKRNIHKKLLRREFKHMISCFMLRFVYKKVLKIVSHNNLDSRMWFITAW